jgi:hypothetical protein
VDGVGYVARRVKKTQDSSVTFTVTKDGRITNNGIDVFTALVLHS